MTTSKLDSTIPFSSSLTDPVPTHLLLSASEVVARKNGLEFLSNRPLPLWAEVTVDVRSSATEQPLSGTGVVVDCAGTRHSGYVISLLLLDLSSQGQQHLEQLVRASVS